MGRVEENIKYSICKNGFPEKAVKLPFKPIYDCCKQYNASLADVLENLTRENIIGKVKGDFIEFRSTSNPEKTETRDAATPNLEHLQDLLGQLQNGSGTPLSWQMLQKTALEQMAQMTPEQLAELRKRLDNLSDEDKKNILKALGQQIRPAS